MTSNISQIEVHISLADGSVYRFEQREAELAREALRNLQPSKVFSESTLTVAGEYHTTTFPTSFVTRVELRMDEQPSWSFILNLTDVIWISEKRFRDKVKHESGNQSLRREQPRREGESFVGYDEVELVSGEFIYLEIHGITGPRAVRARAVSRLLESPSLSARHEDGRWVIMNPRNILCLSSYPGPPDLPTNAVRARFKGIE